MEIRFAGVRDIPGILELLRQVGGVHHDIRPDIFRCGAIKYTRQELENILSDKDSPIFVAVEGDKVLGYSFCQIREYRGSTVLTDRKEIYIDDLCVEEACRGRGIARALYGYVTDWAKEIGCTYVTLNVWQGNENAMKFYEKMGMRQRSITMETKL